MQLEQDRGKSVTIIIVKNEMSLSNTPQSQWKLIRKQ